MNDPRTGVMTGGDNSPQNVTVAIEGRGQVLPISSATRGGSRLSEWRDVPVLDGSIVQPHFGRCRTPGTPMLLPDPRVRGLARWGPGWTVCRAGPRRGPGRARLQAVVSPFGHSGALMAQVPYFWRP